MPKIISFSIYIVSVLAFIAGVILLVDVSNAVRNPATYQFGEIAMMAKWGEAYRSLNHYVGATLKTAGIFFFCSTLLASFGSLTLLLKNKKI
jgi:hypothetical protein